MRQHKQPGQQALRAHTSDFSAASSVEFGGTLGPAMAPDRIISFYSGEEPDHRGRYFREIQTWPDDRLETS